MSESTLFLGILFGSIGLGYFIYGRRQRAVVPLLCGLGLMIVPYFITATWPLVLVSTAMAVLPYFVRL